MSGAVSIRCTMSWSVPWVAMVTNVEAMIANTVYSVSNIPLMRCQPCSFGSRPVAKNSSSGWLDDRCDVMPLQPPGMAKKSRQSAATALPIMIVAWMKSVQITALMPPSVV